MGELGVDQWANVAASMLAFLACVGFAVVYHTQAPWWRTDVGRNLMLFAAAVGALCLHTVLITVWPEGGAAAVLRGARTGVLVSIAVLMVQRTRMVIAAQHERHDRSGV